MSTAADNILATIRSAVGPSVGVYDAIVNGVPPPRYVVLYTPSGLRQMTSILAISDSIYLDFQTTCVASDADPTRSSALCRWLSTTVRDALTDLVLPADGWAPGRIKHEGSQSPRPDEETPDKKVYATDQFSLETVRIS